MSAPSKPTIAIIDYGMGNLFNVQRVCKHVGLESIITADKKIISQAQGLIVPGVGAFGDAMKNLKDLDLLGVIKDHIGFQKPFLGICLGMQLLFTESEEFGKHQGMGAINGRVIRFNNQGTGSQKTKVPQVGWNRIYFKEGPPLPGAGETLRQTVADGEYMYFVHSYYVLPEDPAVVLTLTRYGNTEYCSSCVKGSILAMQFHPERSGTEGLKIYEHWARHVRSYEESLK